MHSTQSTSLSSGTLAIFGAALAATALCGPSVVQPESYHAFADQRELFGMPHAMDVISNLPFLLLGLLGLARLPHVAATWKGLTLLLYTGLLMTFSGSGIYHLAPSDHGLLLDRLGMLVLFAAILGLATADRLGFAQARWVLTWVGLGGAASLAAWWYAGNLLPWVVLQVGGVLVLLLLACSRPQANNPTFRLGLCVLCYGLAKLCELADEELFRLSGELLSGHSLKHLLSGLAVLPLLQATTQGCGRQRSGSPV